MLNAILTKLILLHLLLPGALPQGVIFGGTSGGGGGSLTYGSGIGCVYGATTTVVSTNQATTACASGSAGVLNLPAGALAFGFAYFQGTAGTETIAFTDTAGNTFTAGNTLQYNSAAGSSQMFFAKNTTANTADAGTCTISSALASVNAICLMGYITGASTSSPQDVSSAGNANDGGSSGTAITSASFSTTTANEFILACEAQSVNAVTTAGNIGGSAATIGPTSQSSDGSAAFLGLCEYRIVSSTLSTQTATMTAGSSTRWNVGVNSFHP